jgi:hypothetical protein
VDDDVRSLASRLDALEDRRAIDDLYYNYLWLLDGRLWQRLADEVFAPDAELVLGGHDTLRGREAIAAVLARKMGVLQATAHYYTNLVAELAGGSATARGYIQSWHWAEDATPGEPVAPTDFIGIGAFVDELRKDDGRWWIIRRRRQNLGPSPVGFGELPPGFEIAGLRGRRSPA